MTFYAVRPVPAPRMTRADVWKERPCVLEYRDFKDQLRAVFSGEDVAILLEPVRVVFHLPMPESWSQKKQQAHEMGAHLQRPDLDNLLKALLDAALPDGDQRVWCVRATKIWCRMLQGPGIEIDRVNPWT